MIIRNEEMGVVIDAKVRGSNVEYKVIEQSEKATKALKALGKIVDEETGFGVRSNKYPSFNHEERNFYIRGSEPAQNNKIVTAKFESPDQARQAIFAFETLISKISDEKMVPETGGTTHVRQAILTGSQARIIKLTGSKHYPEKRLKWPGNVMPIKTEIQHYNEHIGQVVDVLNKSVGNVAAEITGNVVNPHKVASADARYAIKEVQDLFDRAEARGEGSLIALWRVVSGMRAPDVKNEDLEEHRRPGYKRSDR